MLTMAVVLVQLVALACLVIKLNAFAPILMYPFQLSPKPPLTTRPFIASTTTSTSTVLYERQSNEKIAAAASTTITTNSSAPSLPAEWIQQDLEAKLMDDDVKLQSNLKKKSDTETPNPDATTIEIIFCDIDGSLVHYPKKKKHHDDDETQQDSSEDDNKILALPPSATGMQGIISSRTLKMCRDLRVKKGVKLVMVTGGRTSTLLNRLPYLPKADVYCTEGGGRIFYPTDSSSMDTNHCCHEATNQFIYTPVKYSGANTADLKPFGLREDMTWRKRMEMGGAVGIESYAGNEVYSSRCSDVSSDGEVDEECPIDYESTEGFPLEEDEVPIVQRKGHLWDFANQLMEQEGFVLDTKSYSTCFRVNKKHQTNGKRFDDLLNGEIPHPTAKIAKSTNLGCIDFYPASSGKKNCCQYIANEFGFKMATESVCICDDENDSEMALACSHAYIPSLTSERLVDTLRRNQCDFTLTFGTQISSTAATEMALQSIYSMTRKGL